MRDWYSSDWRHTTHGEIAIEGILQHPSCLAVMTVDGLSDKRGARDKE